MARKSKLAATTLALTISFCLAFLQTSSWPQLRTVKVGTIPIVAVLPLFAALDQGYFQKEGLEIKATPMAGGAVIIPAMIGGSLDVGFSAYDVVITTRARGMDVTIIAASAREIGPPRPYVGIIAAEGSGINSAKDLEGKTFAVNVLKSLVWVTASEWMAMNGADPKKVNMVEIPFPNQGAALRTKTVDAFTSVDPFMSIELERGGVKVIGAPFAAVDPKLPIAGFTATASWVKNNRELTERFVRALYKGTDYLKERPEKRGEILAKFTGVEPALAAKLRFYPEFDRYIDAKALQKVVDLTVKWGLISERVDINALALPGVLK